jgi:methylglutaconyl-CoA hydratase
MGDTIVTAIDASGIAAVTLNRPDVHNALNSAMVAALTAALRDFDADPAVRAVVLAANGDHFCAGADIGEMRAAAHHTRTQNEKSARAMADMFHTLHTLAKPTIVCIHGAVRGGGVGLVAASDIAIAGHSVTFRLSEVRLGIIPAMISPYLIAAVGARNARRYFITGETFDAAEAHRIGLLHGVVDDDELPKRVSNLLAQLLANGPAAVIAAKALISEVQNQPIDDALIRLTAARIADIRTTAEAQEGLAAFLEKRGPRWPPPKKTVKDITTEAQGRREKSKTKSDKRNGVKDA